MWDDLVRNLGKYPTAVLTVTDAAAYPFSIRCVPEPDPDGQVLRVNLPAYVDVQTGPAGLLCHFHDDLLWNQTNFVAYGVLERDGSGWVFRPTRLIEGAGAGMSFMRQARGGRSSAQRYLDKRGLAWPTVPWARLHAIYEKAQRTGR
jgi:hypothetical protein